MEYSSILKEDSFGYSGLIVLVLILLQTESFPCFCFSVGNKMQDSVYMRQSLLHPHTQRRQFLTVFRSCKLRFLRFQTTSCSWSNSYTRESHELQSPESLNSVIHSSYHRNIGGKV